MRKITQRQSEVLTFVEQYTFKHGSPPTRAEIAHGMGFTSPNAAEDHLRSLAKKGYLSLLPGTSRGIQLSKPPQSHALFVPMLSDLSKVTDFTPAHSQELTQYCIDERLFHPKPQVMVKILDNSLLPYQIKTQDAVLIHLSQRSSGDHPLTVLKRHQEILIQNINTHPNHEAACLGFVVGVIRAC